MTAREKTTPRQAIPGKITAAGCAIVLAVFPAAALAESEESGGLPQLDISTWPTQIFWLIITFGLAYLLMSRLVTPRIGAVLEERRAKIEDDMQSAREAADDAADMRAAWEEKLAAARMSAIEKTRIATAEAKNETDTKNTAAVSAIGEKLDAAEKAIEDARKRALSELDAVAAESAVDAVAAVAGITVNKKDAKSAVAAIASMRGATG